MNLREFLIICLGAFALAVALSLIDIVFDGITLSTAVKGILPTFLLGFFILSFARAMASFYQKKKK